MAGCSKCGSSNLYPQCGCKDSALTTIPGCDNGPLCIDPNPCAETFLSDCIIFSCPTILPTLSCTILCGDSLTTVLTKLMGCISSGVGDWRTLGNSGTVDGVNFIGTLDNIPWNIRVNNQPSGRLDPLTRSNIIFHSPQPLGTTFFGYQAGLYNDNRSGTYAFVGVSANQGMRNTGIGYQALQGFVGPATSSGYDCTAVGFQALSIGGIQANTAIGSYADVNTRGSFNRTVIGYRAIGDVDNSVTLGNHTVVTLQFNGSLAPYYGGIYNEGTPGQVLTSQGPGVAPIWI